MKHNMLFASLSSFFQILRETFKIFFRNGKLLPSVTLAYVSINSLLSVSFIFATKHIVTDYTAKKISIATAKNHSLQIVNLMKHEARILLIAYLVFFTLAAIVSVIFAVAAISASTEKKQGTKVSESWRRALVTVSYKVMLKLGFTLVVLVFLVLPIELFSSNHVAGKISTLSKAVIFISMALYLHLAVVWFLAIVVSVVEEKSGFGAFYRSSGLVKELRVQGFLVNVLFGVLAYAFYEAFRAIGVGQKPELTGMNVVSIAMLMVVDSVVKVFFVLSYVALYFEGKKICGEEVMDLQGYTMEYVKVPASATFVPSDIP